MISLNWVKDFIDLSDENPKDLAVKVTQSGVNVEAVKSQRIENLVIGQVKECVAHPDSDHLHICQVDIGKEVTQIVCGASNVRAGIKVIVALPGCILPDGLEIKPGKIRNQQSNGMICALFELGVEPKTPENYNKGIAELNTDLEPGSDANLYLGTDDTLFELDVHKHRNNDCYYHIGFAYELATILNRKVTLPETDFKTIDEDVSKCLSVEVKTDKCQFYTARVVKDVKIGQSPEFIRKRLINAGMRSINNLVDISNYVMLEFGQPLHFFDAGKVGSKILVRNANPDEKLVTLDGKLRDLKETDILITDGNKPICLAGVMGGENTEVDDSTKNIIIESAIFDAVSIRNTASRLDLKSEASIRYGKGLNYEYTLLALDRACHLLEKYAGAKVLKGTIKYDCLPKQKKIVKFKTAEINSITGLNLGDDDVKLELKRLDFSFEKQGDTFVVTIPNRRLDIENNVNDIAEEVARLYGYHNLKSELPKIETKKGEYIGDVKIRKETTKRLRSLGLNEVKTYTLVSDEMANMFNYEGKNQIKLPNPMMSDKSVVRTSVLPSLLNVYNYNKVRNIKDILIYEISKTYDSSYTEDIKVGILMKGDYIQSAWQGINVKVNFYLLKGIIENLLNYLGFKNRFSFVKAEISDMHPGICAKITVDREEIGIIGRVHPSVNKDEIYLAEISLTKLYNKQIKPIKFKEANKYPEMSKDVAFVMDENVDSEAIKNQIKKSGGRLLASCEEFDVYRSVGLGKKSIAYSLVFRDDTKTLLENDVMELFNKIIKDVETKTGAKIRE